jgi:hypothetical protein
MQSPLVRVGGRFYGYGWKLQQVTRLMQWGCMMVSQFFRYTNMNLLTNVNITAIWAKAWAWTHHWHEEVQLLNEEMHRVLKFHEYKAHW